MSEQSTDMVVQSCEPDDFVMLVPNDIAQQDHIPQQLQRIINTMDRNGWVFVDYGEQFSTHTEVWFRRM